MDWFELGLLDYIPRYYGGVYHYCKMDTLISIVQDKKLRFSDIRYLNDTTEFVHAIEIYKKVCNSAKWRYSKGFYQLINSDALLHSMYNYEQEYLVTEMKEDVTHGSNKKCRLFVCCFSTSRDELGLWNYYGDNNSGCNIEIELHEIIKQHEQARFYKNNRVTYIEKEKEKLVRKMIDSIYEAWKNDPYQYVDEIVLSEFNVMRVFFKHEAFINEKEFRIVLGIPLESSENKNIKFFRRRNLLIPHIDIPLNKDNFSGITLGPYANNELNERSIAELFAQNQIEINYIEKSKIPLRPISE